MIWPVGAALVASLAALLGSAAILLLGDRAEKAAVWILSFAVGTLAGAATLHLLPRALERRSVEQVMAGLLLGILLFVILERVVRWRQSHARGEHHHGKRTTAIVLLWGDALHNLLDGVVLGVAFSTSRELGLVVTLAVFAHELPQEIGDFAVLLSSGISRGRAMLLNYLSAFAVVPGAAFSFLWSSQLDQSIGMLLPVAAGGFLYIALARLVPTLHQHRGRRTAVVQIGLMIAGALLIWASGEWVAHAHD